MNAKKLLREAAFRLIERKPIEAKDVGGTYAMRDWILGGMQTADDEMVHRFRLIIPQVLVPYFEKC